MDLAKEIVFHCVQSSIMKQGKAAPKKRNLFYACRLFSYQCELTAYGRWRIFFAEAKEKYSSRGAKQAQEYAKMDYLSKRFSIPIANFWK